MPLVTVNAEVSGIDEIASRVGTPLDRISAVRKAVAKNTREARRQATINVSNTSVTYEGKTFIIKRQTAKLARSIQVVSITPLSGTVAAMAEYAGAIEEGHKEIDLKPSLMGKTVPLPVDPNGPISAFGKKLTPVVAKAGGIARIEKMSSTGKTSRWTYIAFRRVGPNSHGWIIKAAPGRPFMAAAGEQVRPQFVEDVSQAVTDFMAGQ